MYFLEASLIAFEDRVKLFKAYFPKHFFNIDFEDHFMSISFDSEVVYKVRFIQGPECSDSIEIDYINKTVRVEAQADQI
jgi:hypothetical protein